MPITARHKGKLAFHDHGDGRHLHIAAYRVTFEGKLVSDSNDRFRVMAVAREIEQAYGLTVASAPLASRTAGLEVLKTELLSRHDRYLSEPTPEEAWRRWSASSPASRASGSGSGTPSRT